MAPTPSDLVKGIRASWQTFKASNFLILEAKVVQGLRVTSPDGQRMPSTQSSAHVMTHGVRNDESYPQDRPTLSYTVYSLGDGTFVVSTG